MMNRSLFWQFFGPQLAVLVTGLFALGVLAWHVGRTGYTREWRHVMDVQTGLAMRLATTPDGALRAPDELQQVCEELHRNEGLRLTLVRPDGTVLADSNADRERMHSHAERPEIADALRTGRGWSSRYSVTLGDDLLYGARRIGPAEAPLGVARVALPRRLAYAARADAMRPLFVTLIAATLLALLLSVVFAQRIVRPVAGMHAALDAIGAGDLARRLVLPPGGHLRELAGAVNETVARLQRHVRALEEERTLRARILAGLAEGLLALDERRRVTDANAAAIRLLGLDGDPLPLVGALLHERVHGADLLALLDRADRQEEPVEAELTLGPATAPRTLWARATALQDGQGGRNGTVVVLGDLTHLRRLERVRRDFVANVSHELRTPITAIRGFAETLRDSEDLNDEQARRFLNIVHRQALQMEAILNDLLLLSRLDEQGKSVARAPVALREILQHAADICRPRAEAAAVSLQLDCPDDLHAPAHSSLLEQAVVNLIDNAIKYAAAGRRVEISAVAEEREVLIRVRDFGPGIAPEHHARIFERFYRIDEGRSRAAGGTGLGLAIVRHVARVHDGSVSVQNAPGGGCLFVLAIAR